MNSVISVKAGVSSNASDRKYNEPPKETYINKLPKELEAKIFSYLKPSDLGNISAVDKRRNEVVSTPGKKTLSLKDRAVYRDFAFNSKDWNKYCNKDVDMEGERDFFPKNIWKELNKPCVAFPEKRIGQTHVITWMPKTIGEEPLTLNSFGRVLKEHFPENTKYNGYDYIWNPIALEHGERKTLKSYWVFMTRDGIPASRLESYATQQGVVANLSKETLYEVPKTLEAVVCISTNYFKSDKRLYSDNPWTFTRYQEQAQGSQVIVGGFDAAGFEVSSYYSYDNDNDFHGVAVCWKSGP